MKRGGIKRLYGVKISSAALVVGQILTRKKRRKNFRGFEDIMNEISACLF